MTMRGLIMCADIGQEGLSYTFGVGESLILKVRSKMTIISTPVNLGTPFHMANGGYMNSAGRMQC